MLFKLLALLVTLQQIVLCTTIEEFANHARSVMRSNAMAKKTKVNQRLLEKLSNHEIHYTAKGRVLPAVPITDKPHGDMIINKNLALHSDEMKKSIEKLKRAMTMEKAFEIAGRETEPVALFAVLKAEKQGKTAKDIDPALVDLAIAEVINAIGNATEKIDHLVLETCRPQLSHLKTLIETTQSERERASQLFNDAESNRLASVSERGDLVAGRDSTETQKANAKSHCTETTGLLQETVDRETKQTLVKEVIFKATAASNDKASFMQSVRGKYKICFDKTSIKGRVVFMDKKVNDHLKSLSEEQRSKIINSLAIDMLQVRKTLGRAIKAASPKIGKSNDLSTDAEAETGESDEDSASTESDELEVMGDDGGVTRCVRDPEGDTMPLLEDTAGKLYGEQLDELHLAKTELAEEEDRCEAEQRDFTETINNFISRIDKSISSIQFYLGEKESARAEINQIENVMFQLTHEFTLFNNDCQEDVDEIVTNEYCAMSKIRENILRIYKKKSALRDVQDCVLTPWEEGTCSIQCIPVNSIKEAPQDDRDHFPGYRTDTRSIDVPNNQYGARCARQEMKMPCNNIPCPQDCELGDWGEYGPCSTTCDEGTHSRSRPVITPARFQGIQCGETVETDSCNMKACGNDCVLSGWSMSPCQTGCGRSYKIFTKSVVKESSGVGYAECPGPLSRKRQWTYDKWWVSWSCRMRNPCPHQLENYHCAGDQSVFFAIDVSGSVTSAGLDKNKKLFKVLFEMFADENVSTGLAIFGTKLTPIADLKKNQDLSKLMDQIVYAKGGSSSNAHLAIEECIRQIEFENDGSRTATCVLMSDGSYSRRVALKEATDRAHEKGIRVFIVQMNFAKEYVGFRQARDEFATRPVKKNHFYIWRYYYGASDSRRKALARYKAGKQTASNKFWATYHQNKMNLEDKMRPIEGMTKIARKVCSKIVDKNNRDGDMSKMSHYY